MSKNVIALLFFCMLCIGVLPAQSNAKHKSVTLTIGSNVVYIDSSFGLGDTLLFSNPKVRLRDAMIQTDEGANVKQHRLKGNVIDESTAYMLQQSKKHNLPMHIYVLDGNELKKQWYYEVKFQ